MSWTPYQLYIALTIAPDGTDGVINRCSKHGNTAIVQSQVPLLLLCFERCIELRQQNDAVMIRQNMRSLPGYQHTIDYMDKKLKERSGVRLNDGLYHLYVPSTTVTAFTGIS